MREEDRGVAKRMSRRQLLCRSAAFLAAASLTPAWAQEPAPTVQKRRTRLILLGTKGGPRPGGPRSAPAQVIVVDDVAYVIDCGDGVARQLANAGIPLRNLRHIFITHQHSDHNADYGNLILLSWASGMQSRIDVWGPPPLAAMTGYAFKLNEYDIEARIKDVGWKDIRTLVHPHEISAAGVVMQDERVRVTAALVPHPPVFPNFAYRFDTPDRSIVISGDTAPSDELVALAKGADVLVHEAFYVPALERLVARAPNPQLALKHQLASHTPTTEIGKIATRAGVKTVVLSHFVPGDDPTITDEMWAADVRRDFAGEVIVGRDLLEI